MFAQSPFDKVLACSNFKRFRYEWIWVKSRATGHFNANRMPLKAHENILVFYQKMPRFYPQKTVADTPVHSFTKKVDVQNRCRIYGKASREITGGGTYERYQRDVLFFAKDPENYHPTQKPVALLEYLIRSYTEVDSTVLDPCMGSGSTGVSTGVACVNSGRNFIGIEMDSEYFAVAEQRINQNAKNVDRFYSNI